MSEPTWLSPLNAQRLSDGPSVNVSSVLKLKPPLPIVIASPQSSLSGTHSLSMQPRVLRNAMIWGTVCVSLKLFAHVRLSFIVLPGHPQ